MPSFVHAGAQGNTQFLRAYVFRVEEGLGNAILLQFPDETCAIVDWGTQRDEPLELALKLAKKSRVRVVAATHDHADHTLGLVKLLERFVAEGIKIERFVYPTSQLSDLDHLTRARIRAMQLNIPSHPVSVRTNPKGKTEPDYLDSEDNLWDLMVLAPSNTDVATNEIKSFQKNQAAGNPTSLVVLFAFDSSAPRSVPGEGKALFPGDATDRVLKLASHVASQSGLDLNNQLMVIPHHGGSKVVPGWLEQNIHGVAVISARTNSPHHPKLKTLQQLANHTCQSHQKKLYCTSYAQACRERFEGNAGEDKGLVAKGPCFGHLVIRVPMTGSATLDSSSHPGEERRRFGWCGNLNTITT